MKIKLRCRPLSLTFRLTLFISITAIAAFLVFSWITIHSVEKHFEELDINELQQVSTSLSQLLNHNDLPEKVRIEKMINAISQHDNISVYLENESGQILFQSSGGPDFQQIIKQSPTEGEYALTWQDKKLSDSTQSHNVSDKQNHGQSAGYRVMLLSFDTLINGQPSRYRMAIALSIDFHLHYIKQLTHNLTMAALLICLIIIFVVHFAVYQGHAPLRQVSKKIQSITSENLDVRLQPDDVPIELQQLVVSFNSMIERIEGVFKRQSNFSADIAHEIRTPITNLVTQTQIALCQQRSPEDYQEVLYSNLEEYEHMAKMVSDMLFLAQADNNLLIPESEVIDLNAEVGNIFEYFEAWAEEKGVLLRLVGYAQPIKGDSLMIRRVMNNLLSNAIRYTPEGQYVLVTLSQCKGGVKLSVANPGLPIAAEHLPRLFDRFYRIDKSRQRKSEGCGIGLAIVKSIVEAHLGNVSVRSGPELTEFTVYIPQ